MRSCFTLAAFLVASLSACATSTALTPVGGRVQLVAAAEPHCREVGPVSGLAGAGPDDGYDPDVLVEQATWEAMNRAAARGADTIVAAPPRLDGRSGIVVSGTAYRCAPDALGGWVPARLWTDAPLRRAPQRNATVTRTVPAGTAVQVKEQVVNGFRRVQVEGSPSGFVEDVAVELVR